MHTILCGKLSNCSGLAGISEVAMKQPWPQMSLQSCQIYIKPLYSIYSYRFLSSYISYKIHIAAVCFYGQYKLCKYILPDKLCNSLVMIQALHQKRRDPVQCINSTETLHSL